MSFRKALFQYATCGIRTEAMARLLAARLPRSPFGIDYAPGSAGEQPNHSAHGPATTGDADPLGGTSDRARRRPPERRTSAALIPSAKNQPEQTGAKSRFSEKPSGVYRRPSLPASRGMPAGAHVGSGELWPSGLPSGQRPAYPSPCVASTPDLEPTRRRFCDTSSGPCPVVAAVDRNALGGVATRPPENLVRPPKE